MVSAATYMPTRDTSREGMPPKSEGYASVGSRQGSAGESAEIAYRLAASRNNSLDGLSFRSLRRSPPGPGEVEIRGARLD